MPLGSVKKLGKYLLKSHLGQGGMGVVYLATDTRLLRDVALKVLPQESASDREAVHRLLREARAAAKLNHPNVVAVHDVDQHQGICFIAMELVTGGTVQQLMKNNRPNWLEATRIVLAACRGLGAAHRAGLIHRDIKPANLMIAADGTIKVADFGLAKELSGGNPLTHSASIFGTPDYMSPEQCRGDALDPRSDIYSLGATYYALLTGQPPFVNEQPLQVMFAHCSKSPSDPSTIEGTVPNDCAAIVLRTLQKDRALRYQSTAELEEALVELLSLSGRDGITATTSSATTRPESQSNSSGIFAKPATVQALAPTTAWEKVRAVTSRPITPWVWGILLTIVAVGSLPWFGFGSRTGLTTESPIPSLNNSASGYPHLKHLADLSGISSAVHGLALSADGGTLYSGSMDGGVREWNLAEQKVTREFAGTKQGIRALAANDQWVVAGGDAKTMWLWRKDQLQPVQAIADFKGEISSLAISPNGKQLAVGTYSEARLYSLSEKGATPTTVLGDSGNSNSVYCYMVKSIRFSPDGRFVAATTWGEKGVALWETDQGKLQHVTKGIADDVIGLAFVARPGPAFVVFGSLRNGLFGWDSTANQAERIAGSRETSVRSLAVLNDQQTVVGVGEWGGYISAYNLKTGERTLRTGAQSQSAPLSLVVSADNKYLVTSGGDESHPTGYIQLWQIGDETP